MSRGVILYGPPASGKDSVDAALRERRSEYVHFARIKVGQGGTAGYRVVTKADLNRLRLRREVIWENQRYGSTYVVDRSGILEVVDIGDVPVVHLGQVEAVEALTMAFPDIRWTVVELWCPDDVAAERLRKRDVADVEERMQAWHETGRLAHANVRVDTSTVLPDLVASMVDSAVFNDEGHG